LKFYTSPLDTPLIAGGTLDENGLDAVRAATQWAVTQHLSVKDAAEKTLKELQTTRGERDQ
jgi:hypothetical protein